MLPSRELDPVSTAVHERACSVSDGLRFKSDILMIALLAAAWISANVVG